MMTATGDERIGLLVRAALTGSAADRLYTLLMWIKGDTNGALTVERRTVHRTRTMMGKAVSDLAFLLLGLVVFAVFGGYAALLRRA